MKNQNKDSHIVITKVRKKFNLFAFKHFQRQILMRLLNFSKRKTNIPFGESPVTHPSITHALSEAQSVHCQGQTQSILQYDGSDAAVRRQMMNCDRPVDMFAFETRHRTTCLKMVHFDLTVHCFFQFFFVGHFCTAKINILLWLSFLHINYFRLDISNRPV